MELEPELDGEPKKPYCDPLGREDLLNMEDLEWPDMDLV